MIYEMPRDSLKKVTQSFKKGSIQIRPSRGAEETLNPPKIFNKYYVVLKELKNVEERGIIFKLFEISKYIFDEEEKRCIAIEQKATISLSAIGILVAIIVGFASAFLGNKLELNNVLDIIILCLYFAGLVYLLRATTVALGIVSRVKRYIVGPDDLLPNAKDEALYLLQLSEKYIKYTIENYKIDNRQLDSVWVSQICLRNGIFSIAMGGLLIGVRAIFGFFTHSKPVIDTINLWLT